MAVEQVGYSPSEGLAGEIAAVSAEWTPEKRTDYLAGFPSLDAWLDEIRHVSAAEVTRVASAYFPAGGRVLDVGVGSGRSTLLLREMGHDVTAVEPVPEMCALLAEACARWHVDQPRIVCAPAEEIADIGGTYDAVMFNASFHHVEDVPAALNGVKRLLRPGGVVALVNEPQLPFFTSQRRWRRKIEAHPEAMGHYGGNEHIYRTGEYLRLLQDAGFGDVRADLHGRNSDYRTLLVQIAQKRVDGVPVYSDRRLLARAVYFGVIAEIAGHERIVRWLQRGSLVTSSYIGTA